MAPIDKNRFSTINSLFTKFTMSEKLVGTTENPTEELNRVINELQIYQAELEVQNEELRRVHKELETSRNKYYDLFNQAPSGNILLTEELLVKEINVAALDLCGLKRSEAEKKPFLFLLRSKDCDRCMAYLNDIKLSRQPEDIIVQLKKKNRQFKTVQLTGALSPYDSKNKQLLLSITDLTELQQTQSALLESENLYRSLVNSSEDHLFMLTVDGFFLTSNGKAPYLGKNEEIILTGKHLSEVFYEDHAEQLIASTRRIVLEGEQDIFNCRYQTEEVSRYLTYHLYPIHKDDSLWAIGAICHDVTQQREIAAEKESLEEQLRQSQKLESIGNLAGGIAHDFNNILSAILGYCELALDQVEAGSSLEEDLLEVRTGGERARKLVQQILSFASNSQKDHTPVKVSSVVEETVKFIRSTIPTNIEIRTSIEGESHVLSNSTEMHQVLMNLLTNGAQSMDADGGVLTIKVVGPKGEATTDDQKDVQITVSDTGCGIEPSVLDKIFDPYFTTKEIGKGSGMGLSVVHGIVSKIGGTIKVESVPNCGTSFTLVIPTCSPKNSPKRTAKQSELETGNESILLIDDEPALIKMGEKLLTQLGYAVKTAPDSFEALQIFRQEPERFDLVLSDVTMPGMTGERLAEELLKIRPDLPIVLCTGFSRRITENDFSQYGVKALLYKPFVRADLALTIRKALAQTVT